jgi:hypothetical protein
MPRKTPTLSPTSTAMTQLSPCRWLFVALLASNAFLGVLASNAQAQSLEDWEGVPAVPAWRVRGEYLLWWSNGNPLPPLVTTSPFGTDRDEAGVIGTPGAEILFGGESIATGARSGGRLTLSRWLDNDDITAIEFVGIFVGDDYQSGDFVRQSLGTPIYSRPFFNVDSGEEDAELVALTDILAGRVAIASYSEAYSGATLLRHNIGRGETGRLDLLGGYRYFRYRETLQIRENLESIDQGGVIPLGTTTDLIDRFATGNDFHGAEFGLAAEFFFPSVFIELTAKVALGSAFRQAVISGNTVVTVPGDPSTTTAGGLLALPTNIGTYSDSTFGVLPELGLNTSIALTPDVNFLFGYSLIVLNDVLRTGNQIDRVINTSQIGDDPLVGDPRPAFSYRDSTFVLQGLNFGVEYLW